MAISSIDEAITALRRGGMIIVADDENRENEGDIIALAETITVEQVAFMMRACRGLICVAMDDADISRLDLPQMVTANSESMKTAFTVSVDYLHGTSSGISASDRAATILALARADSNGADFARPGHIFPLRAHPQGLAVRQGHTEAAVEFARLAGRRPCGVICEICLDDGSMARLPDLEIFACHHKLPLVTIADLIAHLEDEARLVAEDMPKRYRASA